MRTFPVEVPQEVTDQAINCLHLEDFNVRLARHFVLTQALTGTRYPTLPRFNFCYLYPTQIFFFKISGFMVVNTHAVFSQEKTLTFFLCSLYKSCFIKCQEEKVLMGNFLMAETLSSDETRANIGKFGIKLTNTPKISNELLSIRSAFRSQ